MRFEEEILTKLHSLDESEDEGEADIETPEEEPETPEDETEGEEEW